MEKPQPHVLTFQNGRISTLYTDKLPLGELGAVTRKRASHIRPAGFVKRIAFIVIRACFGDDGFMANWTRHWPGPWTAHLIANRQDASPARTFTAPTRAECLRWEYNELNK